MVRCGLGSPRKSGAKNAFQSPCAGNMFGKKPLRSSVGEGMASQFQSPCAGNMFGKVFRTGLRRGTMPRRMFQSPCAGNMFGKWKALAEARKARQTSAAGAPAPTVPFQSPCAGNMFGKSSPTVSRPSFFVLGSFNPRVRGTCLVRWLMARCSSCSPRTKVSIPVCGEHVW